jgi:hypothetical protein
MLAHLVGKEAWSASVERKCCRLQSQPLRKVNHRPHLLLQESTPCVGFQKAKHISVMDATRRFVFLVMFPRLPTMLLLLPKNTDHLRKMVSSKCVTGQRIRQI